ncbi:molybdate ABC transporter substrate-binding protein [Cellulomonas oligotrophica]|uniref:Molybdate transport system substrate-binding protein n=1 Tax=Cellulomonas oligotrophica TaxID=931536 RepID=A0A7Y9FET9_9CELL|nr:molybdate ABC transporter substrate-binding protein [Cellulomonas oligotrophica]NYD86019.1 molybdate transport system substrate-binding protein [Cellulomonas oligotrophica]GIG30973.1 molybdate-binding protein [Cellulomonas oligotrophica]
MPVVRPARTGHPPGRALATGVVLAVALTGGCTAAGAHGTDDAPATTLVVLAAASLRDVFTDLAATYEQAHPGVDVVLSSAGSADLADQVLAGAPADVVALADETSLARVVDAGDAADPVPFATNTLTVVTPPDDPAGVGSFADLARKDVAVVVCAPAVPCGAAAVAVEDAAGVRVHRVGEEQSVTDVLAKVVAGEADAGLVYVTDAARAGDDVRVVDVPETDAAVNVYPVAVTTSARDRGTDTLAAAWVDLLTGPDGRAALTAAGFGTP